MIKKPTPNWIDNIKTDLQEVGCNEMAWMNLDQQPENGLCSEYAVEKTMNW
jgi:hypothetical protein